MANIFQMHTAKNHHVHGVLFQKIMNINIPTKDGSVNTVPQILYGQYLILGAFGNHMFYT